MRKLVVLTFFLIIFSGAAAVLQNLSDFAMLQKPVAAQQTNTNSAPPRKPNDSVSDAWRTTISDSKILSAAVTTNGKTPTGEAQTILQLQCRADSNEIASIGYIVLDALKIKSFNFSDFEGPDAPVKLEKLVEFRAVSPSGSLIFRDSVAGYYNSAGETIGFYFTTYPTRQNKVKQLVQMIAEGSTKVTVIVHGYRNNRKTIETTFPAMDGASAAAKTFGGCRK